MKPRTAMGIALSSLVGTGLGIGGYTLAVDHNTVPLVQQVTAAGYAIGELSEPLCGEEPSDCGEGAITTSNKNIVEVAYRPAGSPRSCEYRFRRISSGLTHKSSWEFWFHANHVDGISPRLGSTSGHIMGAGDGWTSDEFKNRWVAIKAPSPRQLWAFAKAHVVEPSPKCKPTGA